MGQQVLTPEGKRTWISDADVPDAKQQGFKLVSELSPQEQQDQHYLDENKGFSGTAKTFAESAFDSLTLGVGSVIFNAARDDQEKRRAELLRQEHSTADIAGTVAGTAGSFLYGGGEGSVIARAGEAASGLAKGTGIASRAGRLALKGAAEGAVTMAPRALADAVTGDPSHAAEDIALAAGVGAPLALLGGLARGAASPTMKLLRAGAEALDEHVQQAREFITSAARPIADDPEAQLAIQHLVQKHGDGDALRSVIGRVGNPGSRDFGEKLSTATAQLDQRVQEATTTGDSALLKSLQSERSDLEALRTIQDRSTAIAGKLGGPDGEAAVSDGGLGTLLGNGVNLMGFVHAAGHLATGNIPAAALSVGKAVLGGSAVKLAARAAGAALSSEAVQERIADNLPRFTRALVRHASEETERKLDAALASGASRAIRASVPLDAKGVDTLRRSLDASDQRDSSGLGGAAPPGDRKAERDAAVQASDSGLLHSQLSAGAPEVADQLQSLPGRATAYVRSILPVNPADTDPLASKHWALTMDQSLSIGRKLRVVRDPTILIPLTLSNQLTADHMDAAANVWPGTLAKVQQKMLLAIGSDPSVRERVKRNRASYDLLMGYVVPSAAAAGGAPPPSQGRAPQPSSESATSRDPVRVNIRVSSKESLGMAPTKLDRLQG